MNNEQSIKAEAENIKSAVQNGTIGDKRSVVVELGDQEFTIKQLPTRPATAWRKKLVETDLVQEIKNIVTSQTISKMFQSRKAGQERGEMMISNMELSPELLNSVQQHLNDAPDVIFDLLYAYSPTLRMSRDYIDEHAYDDQLIAALVEVLKLVFPLGQLKAVFRGLTGSTTSRSLSSPNTESGTTIPTSTPPSA